MAHQHNDWEERQFIETIQLSVLKLTKFLNQFDVLMQSKIANINERLVQLERNVEHVQMAVDNTATPFTADEDDEEG